jgi:hypothetical protein
MLLTRRQKEMQQRSLTKRRMALVQMPWRAEGQLMVMCTNKLNRVYPRDKPPHRAAMYCFSIYLLDV